MSITRSAPNTILLGGEAIKVNDLACSEAITPGMLIERALVSTTFRWKKAATAKKPGTAFALEPSMLNKGITDAYAANDLVEAAIAQTGASVYAIIGSGVSVNAGVMLENAGNGKLRAWTDAPQGFVALETVDNSAGVTDARIRVEVA